jgi:hypothetical protein
VIKLKHNSREICDELKITHVAIRKILKLHERDFLKFGNIEYDKIVYGKGTKGGKPKQIIYLNEKHYLLLVLYLSNCNKTIKRKKIKILEEYLKLKELINN